MKSTAWRYKALLRCRGWVRTFLACWLHSVRIARRCIGVPDYDTYVAHMRRHHPGRTPMDYAEFFNERQQARYRGGGGRCC